MWSKKQIEQHKKAAYLLNRISQDAGVYIKNNAKCTELEVQSFVLSKMKENNLVMDAHKPIVAFGKNTAHVHYFPGQMGNAVLKNNTLILLDIWARLEEDAAPYADMTWMFFYGKKIPLDMQKKFNNIIVARDKVIKSFKNIAKKSLPADGAVLDLLARDYLQSVGFGKNFCHSLGHSLGTRSPHGVYSGLQRRSKTFLRKPMGYTIEPGIYFPGKYGFRTEVDGIFLENSFEITTSVQKSITLLLPL